MLQCFASGKSSGLKLFARYSREIKPRDPNDKRSEYERMLAGDLYDASDPHLVKLREQCRAKMERYNLRTSILNLEDRSEALADLLGHKYENLYIEPPVYFDYGIHTKFGKNCYFNYGCTILDVNRVTFGDFCMLGPNVSIYTATHPTDYEMRNAGPELGWDVKIGNCCWIGGSAVICPGVTIGDNVVVASGAVVTKDVPSNVVVAGNPAKIIKHLKPYKKPEQ